MRVKVDTEANARRSFLRAAAAVASGMLTITVAGRASAQSMIETLRILCVAGPGSAPDFVARRVAEQLSGRLAKNAIVDNRPGATGRIAVSRWLHSVVGGRWGECNQSAGACEP
jgi:tripartite-type tricarboxylate transporter receptor subunit TctC